MLNHKTLYRVRYADTDKMGFAHHANYLRWFEIGRSELLRHMGITYKEIEARGFFLPLSESYCKFHAPAGYDDLIAVVATLDENVKVVLTFDYRIYDEGGKKLLAKGYTKHACMNSSGRVVRPPDFLVDMVRENRGPA